jgi:hypothetical protein
VPEGTEAVAKWRLREIMTGGGCALIACLRFKQYGESAKQNQLLHDNFF